MMYRPSTTESRRSLHRSRCSWGRRGRAAVLLRLRCAAADADAVLVLVAQRGNEVGALTGLLAAAGALAYRVAAFRAGGVNGVSTN